MEIPKPLPLPMFTSSGLIESSPMIPRDAVQCQVNDNLQSYKFRIDICGEQMISLLLVVGTTVVHLGEVPVS